MPVLYLLPAGPCAGEARPGVVTRVYPKSGRVDVSVMTRNADAVHTGRSVVELAKVPVLHEPPEPKDGQEPFVVVFREMVGRVVREAPPPAPPPPPPPPSSSTLVDADDD